MILKNADDKVGQINELQRLISIALPSIKPKIEQELRFLRAGIKGEQEVAYLIDFNLGKSKNSFVIHDLRFEFKGRVAQIDHLLIHRTLNVYVIETKHFNSGIKVNDNGEFMQWNSYKKTFEGIASPFAQNERHISVLQDIFDSLIEMPTRLGVKLQPTFHSQVLVNSSSRIDRPKNFDTSNLIKAEMLITRLDKDLDEMSAVKFLAKIVSPETTESIARQLMLFNRPIQIDYAKKFGLNLAAGNSSSKIETVIENTMVQSEQEVPEAQLTSELSHQCKKCNSKNIKIQYGKFGYYFKCEDCGGNSNIKISCGIDGHHERLRKDGSKFFRECDCCKTSSLYFAN